MNRQETIDLIRQLWLDLDNNSVRLGDEDVPAMGEPLIGFASADDPLFELYKEPGVIGPDWLSPKEWMPEGKTVVALFFPFSDELRSRIRMIEEPASETMEAGWKQVRKCAADVRNAFMDRLRDAGIGVCDPAADPRFKVTNFPVKHGDEDGLHFCPAWSQRHAAYAAGLGTFGIHRHLITERGCSGSAAAFIIDAEFEPTPRPYTEVYEYCIHCGACVRRCPAGAISDEYKRNLLKCRNEGGVLREAYGRSECAMCMFGVPCEGRNPSR